MFGILLRFTKIDKGEDILQVRVSDEEPGYYYVLVSLS